MKLNLVGAPQSGKSDLAEALWRELVKWYDPLRIIDNYIIDIQERYNLGVGMAASYLADLAIAIERIGQERLEASLGIEHFIVVGSLAESACHTAVNAEVQAHEIAYRISQIVMPVYPLVRMSLKDRTTYLLPYEGDSELSLAIDDQMPLALEALHMPYTVLPFGTETQVEFILNDLRDKDDQSQN